MSEKNNELSTSNREIVTTRVFDAPRSLLFKMFTDPKHVTNWWGPNGFSSTIEEMNVVTGGTWKFIMHGPDGVDYPNEMIYEEIIEPERLTFKHFGGRKEDSVIFTMIVTFEEQSGKTKLTMRLVFPSTEVRDRTAKEYGAVEGGYQTVTRLAEYLTKVNSGKNTHALTLILPSDKETIMIRVFDAPRDLVFKIMNDPNLIPQWWGPRMYTTIVDKMDLKPGGIWRYIQHDSDGREYAFNGVYREIIPSQRVVSTFEFEGMPGHVIINTIMLEERDGKTEMTMRLLFESNEDRDGMLQSGMESGTSESYDRLDDYLIRLQENEKGENMVEKHNVNTGVSVKELTITRIFNASRERVFRAWTDPKIIEKWWGPRGVTNPTCEWDARPGGEIYIVMLAGEELGPAAGMKWPMKGTFKEVTPQSRLVFVSGALDDVDRGSNTFIEQQVTINFEDLGDKTKMNLHIMITKVEGSKAQGALQGMEMGWNQQIDKLIEMVASENG